MLATDKDLNETPKKGRFIQKDEEEIESWVQAIIDNQEAYSSKWENILFTYTVKPRYTNVLSSEWVIVV